MKALSTAIVAIVVTACGSVADEKAAKTDTSTATATDTAVATETETATETATATETNTATEIAAKLEGKVKQTLFGKSVYLEDKLYTLSCNSMLMKFVADLAHPTCTPVTADWKINPSGLGEATTYAWTIVSPDSSVNISGTQPGSAETLTIGGTSYYCYLFDGDGFDAKGEPVYSATHTVLSKKAADRPSQIDPADVFVYMPFSADLCEALQ